MSRPIRERFEEKYMPEPNTGCWFWTGHLCMGRGQIHFNGRTEFAHRISFIINKGPIPDGLIICHHCDEGSCVNPDHLYAGTPQDNVNDKIRRKREVILLGESNGMSKLTIENVKQIRMGMRTIEAMKAFKVGKSTVQAARNFTSWKSVTNL